MGLRETLRAALNVLLAAMVEINFALVKNESNNSQTKYIYQVRSAIRTRAPRRARNPQAPRRARSQAPRRARNPQAPRRARNPQGPRRARNPQGPRRAPIPIKPQTLPLANQNGNRKNRGRTQSNKPRRIPKPTIDFLISRPQATSTGRQPV